MKSIRRKYFIENLILNFRFLLNKVGSKDEVTRNSRSSILFTFITLISTETKRPPSTLSFLFTHKKLKVSKNYHYLLNLLALDLHSVENFGTNFRLDS